VLHSLHNTLRFGHLIEELQIAAVQPKLRLFARAMRGKGSWLPRVWACVDGTIRPIARPVSGQRAVYNGKDRVHALKYQSVNTPDGIMRHVAGPFIGATHDAKIMTDCGLMAVLMQHMNGADGGPYCIFGDPAYALSPWLQRPFKGNILPNSPEQHFNTAMASVRVTVEWGCGKVTALSAYVNFYRGQQLFVSSCGLGAQYGVACLLTNIHTCIYGCQTAKFFDVQPPSAEDYIAGIA
jgi:nuclease HARBI1